MLVKLLRSALPSEMIGFATAEAVREPIIALSKRGFGYEDGFDKFRSSLEELFGQCGEISRSCIPKDYEFGGNKGVAFIDFDDSKALNKATELGGADVNGGTVTVEEAKPRGGGGRSGRVGGCGFDGGRGGRGGGRGRGPSRPIMATPGGTGKKTTFGED